MFTAPPIAPLPYSRVDGPFSTSIWSARKGSMVGAWSWLTVETSWLDSPPSSTATRGPSMPRMIGRPTPGPKLELCTPGRVATVSPRVAARLSSRRSPVRTSTGLLRVSAVSCRALAVTTTPPRSLIWLSDALSCACRVSEAGAEGSVGACCACAAAKGARASDSATERAARLRGERDSRMGGLLPVSWVRQKCYNISIAGGCTLPEVTSRP